MPDRAAIATWTIDPDDPRSPPADLWERLSPAERARIDASLPSEFPAEGEFAPEGDGHSIPVLEIRLTLDRHFKGPPGGGGTYIGSDLPVYYPNERIFSPDIIAVRNVNPHPRDRWHVNNEGRGLDFALEAAYHGNRKKDLETNVARYERLGIREYFVLDLVARRLFGFRLGGDGRYVRLVPQLGVVHSEVLGLELTVADGRLRFWMSGSPVLSPFEREAALTETIGALNVRLESELDRLEQEAQRAELEAQHAELEAQRAELEAQRADQETQRADQETQRADQETQRADQESQRAAEQAALAAAERSARERAVAELGRLRARLIAAGLDPDADP